MLLGIILVMIVPLVLGLFDTWFKHHMGIPWRKIVWINLRIALGASLLFGGIGINSMLSDIRHLPVPRVPVPSTPPIVWWR